MPESLKILRRMAASSALLLLASCGMFESVSLDPQAAPARAAATTPAKAAESKSGLPGAPAQCVREGESCRAKTDTCCAGLVCVGIGSSFCMNRN